MTDSRFFRRVGPFSLGEVAQHIGAALSDPSAENRMVHDIAALEEAELGDVSVFSDRRYEAALVATRAGAVVTSRDLGRDAPSGTCLLLVAEPRLAYAQIGHMFYPLSVPKPGISSG